MMRKAKGKVKSKWRWCSDEDRDDALKPSRSNSHLDQVIHGRRVSGGEGEGEVQAKCVVLCWVYETEIEPQPPQQYIIWIRCFLDLFLTCLLLPLALSIISVSLLAVEKISDISPLFFTGVLEAVVAALFMNIYIVGLNQLSDVEIDKINKPYLPLASGEYSFGIGVTIVASFSILSFWLGWIVGSWPLFWALFVSFVLGTAYSINVPLLRWKRFAVLAAMCILAVRAVIVQLAFFLHMQGLGHAVLASILWYRAKSVDLKSKASITSFYMFIWKLFYAEYLLIPLVR
ncbi:Homogentisate phytyltransferase 1 [Spatholobus suberectus]|nr:Homogentisate phytyltransferase 1 [Spatholobus suberectus]